MSDTIIDMPKVCQMLDAGWHVSIHKNGMGSYTARAKHRNEDRWRRARDGVRQQILDAGRDQAMCSLTISRQSRR